MCDDLNTPRALAAIFEAVKLMNVHASGAGKDANGALLQELSACLDVLGIPRERPVRASGGNEVRLVELLLDVRNMARKENQYQIADFIREALNELGYQLEDQPGGRTGWKKR